MSRLAFPPLPPSPTTLLSSPINESLVFAETAPRIPKSPYLQIISSFPAAQLFSDHLVSEDHHRRGPPFFLSRNKDQAAEVPFPQRMNPRSPHSIHLSCSRDFSCQGVFFPFFCLQSGELIRDGYLLFILSSTLQQGNPVFHLRLWVFGMFFYEMA